jgi:hypothetical protein
MKVIGVVTAVMLLFALVAGKAFGDPGPANLAFAIFWAALLICIALFGLAWEIRNSRPRP